MEFLYCILPSGSLSCLTGVFFCCLRRSIIQLERRIIALENRSGSAVIYHPIPTAPPAPLPSPDLEWGVRVV